MGCQCRKLTRSAAPPDLVYTPIAVTSSLYASNRCGNASDRIDYKAHYNKLVRDKSRTEHRWFGYLVSLDAYRDLRASFELVLARDPAVPRSPLSTVLSSIVPMRFPDHNIQKQGAARVPD